MTSEDLKKEISKIFDEKLTKWKADRLVDLENERKQFNDLFEKKNLDLNEKTKRIIELEYIPREEGDIRRY